MPLFVWGIGVATVVRLHLTLLVHSVCHIWGKRVWNTNDFSKNNWFGGIFSLGEEWHNNHHAFEFSARHGLEWWQLDVTWYLIRFLQAIGLATNVKLPTESQKKRMALV
ncbi:putative lipid desaturase ADS3.2 [Cardamine amara subsp. amara]|uniref:Lipid desaturase ADS3.2 n=1 Tax=Cardamine amara subsp. amara TaxID=228776 RepID=A0ABD0ZJF8_CARAN